VATLVRELRSALLAHRRAKLRMDRQPAYRGFDIGRHSYGEPAVRFASSGARLQIGQFCSLAEGVEILLGGEHRTDWITTYPFQAMFAGGAGFRGHPATKGDVVIGNDVWIGSGALILSGVRIGDGAVIGARAVVARDVPPYTVVSGNPARAVRSRFSARQIESLMHIRWWDWPLERIVQELPLLLSGEVDRFIQTQLAATTSPTVSAPPTPGREPALSRP
jgi:acetyltransferase-like isoleucine patch superfamily enzyme